MSKQCPTPKGAQGQWPGQWMCICCFLVSAYTVIEPFLFPRHVYGCSMLHILCWEWWMRHWIALADSSFYTQGIAGWIYVCSADPVLKCFDLLWFHPYLQPYQSSFSFFLDSNSRLGHHQSEECRLITSIAVCRPSLRSWWEVKVKSCFFYTKSLQVVWQQVCSFARSFADFLSFTDRCPHDGGITVSRINSAVLIASWFTGHCSNRSSSTWRWRSEVLRNLPQHQES